MKKRKAPRKQKKDEKKRTSICWEVARIMTRLPRNPLSGEYCFCPVCDLPYCIGFDGVFVPCATCRCVEYCSRTEPIIHVCPKCERRRYV